MSTPLPTATRVKLGRRFQRRWNFALILGGTCLTVVALTALIGGFLLQDSANAVTGEANLGISRDHWLGTDRLGRDWLARSIVATGLTLLMTLGAALISIVLGVVVGAGLWLCPRGVRETGLRFLELVTAYPGLILAMIVATILGPGIGPVVIAIGLANTLTIARLSANLAASISQQDYVVQARLLGVPGILLLRRHLLPNMAEPLLLVSSSVFALTLMDISALSFLGLGVQVPDYDLGRLLNDALPQIYTNPTSVLGPVLMICLIAFSAMLIGDGLAALADPRSSAMARAAKRRRRADPPAERDATDSSLVRLEDLTVRAANGTTLVDRISLHIDRREIVGLVGESGSGKSVTAMTLAQLLPDELDVEATQLRVDRLDMLGGTDPRELARTVSLVYQDPGTTFTPLARIGSQLRDPLRVHKGMSGADADAHVVSSLDKVHIVDPAAVARKRPYMLSGGMLQRAMIASSMAMEPELIIADEPTTALDVTVQREILRELKRVVQQRGSSMLFISHDIAVVQALCDRVVVMRHGTIVEEVTSAQLAAGEVTQDYTRTLLAATLTVQLGATSDD